jgi:hypothetical protein
VRYEIVLDRVPHWELFLTRTEEEYGESRNSVSHKICESHDVLIANLHGHRVTRTMRTITCRVRRPGKSKNQG